MLEWEIFKEWEGIRVITGDSEGKSIDRHTCDVSILGLHISH